MSTVEGSSRLTTNGLVHAIDAINPRSYVNGDTTWYDLTRYQNHMNLVNTPTFNTAPFNIEFNGTNEYGAIGPNLPINGMIQATFCMWVYATTNALRLLFTRYDTSSIPRYADYVGLTAGTSYCRPRLFLGTTTDYAYWTTDTDAFELNKWQHLAFSVSNITSDVSCYVNGINYSVNVVTLGTITSINQTSNIKDWQLARATGATGVTSYYDFKIGNLQIYDRALTASEIQQNYQNGKYNFT